MGPRASRLAAASAKNSSSRFTRLLPRNSQLPKLFWMSSGAPSSESDAMPRVCLFFPFPSSSSFAAALAFLASSLRRLASSSMAATALP